MRIAMVSEHASPLAALGGADAGGQNVHVAALAAALTRRGHHVRVFTRRDNPTVATQVQAPDGYLVEHVSAGPPADMPKDDLWPHMRDFAADLAPRLAAGRFDVVHTHFWMGAWATLRAAELLGALAEVPLVHTYHALGVVKRRHQGPHDTSPPDRIEVERDLGARMDRIVATATEEVRELAGQGIAADRCRVVPCGVDLDLFTPRPEDRAAAHRPPRILALGRMVERKGVADAVTALRSLPGAELVIAGGPPRDAVALDPEGRRLHAIAQREGVADRVRFIGNVPHEDVPAVIADADVVVSVPWYEPFGIVPLEAMACGRAFVGTAVGGLLDTVVPGRTGDLVPPQDPVALADALRTLLHDPDRRRRYGAAGARHVREHFGWPRIAAMTEQVYAEVAAEVGRDGVRRREVTTR